jgi:glycerol-3-phosphate O-acyltransferase
MIDAVLEDSGLRRTVKNLACAGIGNEKTLVKNAREYLLEIASDYNEKWLHLWEKVLSRLWRAIYDDFVVDQAGIAQIKAIARRMPFVVIPCHRSHVDYLLFSYILYKNNIPLPRVAAGDNMNFWPLGYVFRQSGAFFLRRSFRGNELYRDVFATYIKHLLKDGTPVEFFLEGGRSRTGKMVAPKYGMLSMLIHAYQEKVCDDLAIIPVSIGYDRIIEENSYMTELRGIPKKRESILDVVKSMKVLGKCYGKAYINVGEPIFLKAYFASQQKNFVDMNNAEKQFLYRNIGFRIADRINRVSVITPVALLAAAFLCRSGKEISEDRLLETFNAFYDCLTYRMVNFAPALSTREKTFSTVLGLFCDAGYISKMKKGEGPEEKVFYLLADDKRMNLEYYKNNIIHHFLPLSFAAAAILSCGDKETSLNRMEEGYDFLKRVFRSEFFLEGSNDDGTAGVLSYFKELGLLKVFEEEGILRPGDKECRKKLEQFAGLIESYLESYRVAINACLHAGKGIKGDKEWVTHIGRCGEEMYARGEIRRQESLSQAYFANVLKFLREEGLISSGNSSDKEAGEGRSSITDENLIENLRSRLSNFI